MKRIVLFLITFCFFATLQAQTASIKVATTDSNCRADGTITVITTEGGVGDKRYAIIAPNEYKTPSQSSTVFSGLPSGTYTIGYFDDTSTGTPIATTTAVIGGSYMEMIMTTPTTSLSNTNRYCSENGRLTGTFTGGRSPYMVKVVGPITREIPVINTNPGASKSYTFTDLPSGSYNVTITDACGEGRGTTSPITVTSYGTSLAGATLSKVEVGTHNIYSSSCTSVTFALGSVTITDTNNKTYNPTSYYYGFSVRLKYRNSSGVETYTNSTTVTGTSSLNFTISNFDLAQTTYYQLEVTNRCNNSVVLSQQYAIPSPQLTFTRANRGIVYKGYCEKPTNAAIRISRSTSSGNFTYLCFPYYVEAKSSSETKTYTWNSGTTFDLTDLIPGTSYTITIRQTNASGPIVATLAAITTTSLASSTIDNPNSAQNITFSQTDNYSNYSTGATTDRCNFETFRLTSSNSNPTTAHTGVYTGQSVTYSIVSAPSGVTRSPITLGTGTTTSYGALWTDLPYGTYVIKIKYNDCTREEEKTVTRTRPLAGFGGFKDIGYTRTAGNCDNYNLKATGYFLNSSNNVQTGSYSFYIYFRNKETGAAQWVYATSNNQATSTAANFVAGTYDVKFYSTNSASSCLYAETELIVPPYEGAIVDIPRSGGIVCPGEITGTLTVTAESGTEPYYYRYKVKNAGDDTFSAWVSNPTFLNLPAGNYIVQVKDNCNAVSQQELRIFNNNEQFTKIEGEVDDGKICLGKPARLTVLSIGPVVSCQWQKKISEVWTDIVGATGIYYDILSATSADKGEYRVLVDNGFCSDPLESTIEIIDVLPPAEKPSITGSAKYCATGSGTVLTAVTSITSPTYQWYKDGVEITGATNSTYIANVDGDYTVVVQPPLLCESTPSDPIEVRADPDACIKANDDEYIMNACETDRIIDVLGNDLLGGCDVGLEIKAGPANGTASVVIDTGVKKIKYKPNSTFTGVDEITYEVSCGMDKTTATLKVKVNSLLKVIKVNDASEPTNVGKFRIVYTCEGVKYAKKLTITYKVDASSTALSNIDYLPLGGTIDLLPGNTYVDVDLTPKDNYKVEGNNRNITIEIVSVDE